MTARIKEVDMTEGITEKHSARNIDGPLRVTEVRNWKELAALRPAWESILQDSKTLTIFSTLEWLESWWDAFAQGKELCAPVLYNADGDLVGIVPLYLDTVKTGLPMRLKRLRFAGDGTEDSDNLDFIIRPGYEDSCVQALLSWLASNARWDICELNTFPLDSVAMPSLLSELQKRRWSFRVLDRPRSTISLPDSWESYLKATISKKERTKINYYTNRLRKRFQVSIGRAENPGELKASLEALFELHQKRWQVRGGPGTFASTQRCDFYYRMAAAFLERGWLQFWMMHLDGRAVAAQYGFQFRDAVYSLQEGFDPEFSGDRVGYLLRAHALQVLIGEGVRSYDFLGGEDPSKDRWGAVVMSYKDVHFARPGTKGSAFLQVDEAVKESKKWVRNHLPKGIVNVLRGTYRGIAGGQERKGPPAGTDEGPE